MRIGLKGMTLRMALRRILHLREKSNLISVLSHDSESVHFLWKPFWEVLDQNCIGNLGITISNRLLLFDVEPYYLSPFWDKGGDFLEERVSL